MVVKIRDMVVAAILLNRRKRDMWKGSQERSGIGKSGASREKLPTSAEIDERCMVNKS